ncbi:hypothetical protein WH47_00893 [Habropoda laboriosa]|uniref:MICOS complex subunit MIC13 n=1 Tax=Habropoda laboriosa TaxID=597456 RepID=A0A0L7R768_9HYME|nr:PREDICTED: uncharacterized protein LOC108571153 [Habropoda laboriosa]KOC66684.1 hypothetical protein WH47_00893 [Habropoda laboriosa]
MKKGTKCVAQTINLSNPKTCIRPKRIQKLVQADVMQPCPAVATATGPSYWTPRPVTIKICSRKDMQRTCPPKLCDCPPKAPPRTLAQKLCGALLFLLKSGIAAGLVYWTHSEGLWGSSADVEDLYRRIVATIGPVLQEEYDADEVQLPSIRDIKCRMIQKYNDVVFTVMSCIVSVPTKLRERLDSFTAGDEETSVETGEKDGVRKDTGKMGAEKLETKRRGREEGS